MGWKSYELGELPDIIERLEDDVSDVKDTVERFSDFERRTDADLDRHEADIDTLKERMDELSRALEDLFAPVVQVKVLPEGTGLDLPRYETDGAAGMDLRAAIPAYETWFIPPGGRKLIPTGLSVELPKGYELQVRPRSGLALKRGVTVLNSPGTVDSDYRGPVGVLVINHGDEPLEIRRGDRIAQAVIALVAKATLVKVVNLSDTARGAGGFGSTGVSGAV